MRDIVIPPAERASELEPLPALLARSEPPPPPPPPDSPLVAAVLVPLVLARDEVEAEELLVPEEEPVSVAKVPEIEYVREVREAMLTFNHPPPRLPRNWGATNPA